MTDLELTYAGAPYLDRMAALQHGCVKPIGIHMNYYEIAHAPDPFVADSPNIRRLFPDYRPVEEDYFRRTGFFR